MRRTPRQGGLLACHPSLYRIMAHVRCATGYSSYSQHVQVDCTGMSLDETEIAVEEIIMALKLCAPTPGGHLFEVT